VTKILDTRRNYVTDVVPVNEPGESEVRLVTLDRIKQALVTSRTTLAGQGTGADPYNSRRDRRRTSVWGNRIR
jgi:hypothetical protein